VSPTPHTAPESASHAAPDLPHIRTPIPGPRSRELAARLSRLESPDATFYSPDFPIFWDQARDCCVIDADGNRYLDMNAGFGAAIIGHSHPALVSAIQEQSARLIHGMGDVHPSEIKLQLAESLLAKMPTGYEWKVIFGNSGSEAIEAAMKTAALATGKSGLIVFEGGYHGLSIGALAATQWPKFHAGFEALIAHRAAILPYPRDESATESVLNSARAVLENKTQSPAPIGAVLVEPVLGRGGVVVPPPNFLRGLRQLCDEFKILLIADEIFTGVARTGAWLASAHDGVVPDLIAVGKALGGGMPISACVGRSAIIDRWGVSRGEARHTSTYLGHPLSCAAALAVLRVLENENFLALAPAKASRLLSALAGELKPNPAVASIRGRGLMAGIELIEPATGKPNAPLAWSIVVESLKRGLILLVSGMDGNVISLTPPLTIGEAQIDFAARTIALSLESARAR
jgi:4-aminobutyrate aminotransferase-like enzyme